MRGNTGLLLLFGLGALVAIGAGLTLQSWPMAAFGVVLLLVGVFLAMRKRPPAR